MKISSVTATGFRLLDGVSVSLDRDTTIIVGRNNSGKTSLVEIFYKFLGTDKASITIDDFSLSSLDRFNSATEKWLDSEKARASGDVESAADLEEQAVAELPTIQLDIEFTYDEKDDLSAISDLILDLDTKRHDALLSCRFKTQRPIEFLKAFSLVRKQDPKASMRDFLRKRLYTHFERELFAVDREDRNNFRSLASSQARNAILCNFIYAQNLFDDTSSDSGRGLSKGFEEYYKAIASVDETTEDLERTLEDFSVKLDGEYRTLFEGVYEDIKQFGANRMPSLQELKVMSEFQAGALLKGSTRVVYTNEAGNDLPEAHNGLGFSKLIFIVLQFVSFFEAYKNKAALRS